MSISVYSRFFFIALASTARLSSRPFVLRKTFGEDHSERVYFETLRSICERIDVGYNPYEVVGSGCKLDVLGAARQAMKETVTEWMLLLGSAGKAEICMVKTV